MYPQNKVIGQKPLPKRAQAGRALRPTDFDNIVTLEGILDFSEKNPFGEIGA